MRQNKRGHRQHHVDIQGDIGKLTAYTKKAKPVEAIFDAADLDKIEVFKNWRAVWQTDFDSQVIESKDFKDKRAIRTPVASAILGCSPNAPIRHLNGDRLDNRRSNLEIYDVTAQPNAYNQVEGRLLVILKDRYARVVGEAIIDDDDLDRVIGSGHVWLKKRHPDGQPYVVNRDGLLLAHFLLGVCEGVVSYQNKNPLDNTRANIKLASEN